MSSISYDTIAPNIAQVNVSGSQVQVQWKCPRTGRMLGSSTGSMSADPSVSGRVGASVKKNVASEVIYGAARAISGLFGGAAGRVVSNATYTAASERKRRPAPTTPRRADKRRSSRRSSPSDPRSSGMRGDSSSWPRHSSLPSPWWSRRAGTGSPHFACCHAGDSLSARLERYVAA
jgi:hypothetical protein